MKDPTVENYKLYASNGKYIRIATKVVFSDGFEIKFIDKMSKREALRNARPCGLPWKNWKGIPVYNSTRLGKVTIPLE